MTATAPAPGPNPFGELGLPAAPLFLAPLAGVSDHPFRRICRRHGADLAYVEMISATALTYHSRRTLDMLFQHPTEAQLGVQITARSPAEMAAAVKILATYRFCTLDINMGCPVRKVVAAGCGSAIMRDPERVYATTAAAAENFPGPVSAKIRLGWDHQSRNAVAVAQAAVAGGARWITVHGRTRSDSYQQAVDLEGIAAVKRAVAVPVIGNGNIFGPGDAQLMQAQAGVDGWMVSRGALGNPWVFDQIRHPALRVSQEAWYETLATHLGWQAQAYGDSGIGAVRMRKHILWYLSGWPHARKVRERITACASMAAIADLVRAYSEDLLAAGHEHRFADQSQSQGPARFHWNPTPDMDRQSDRGVGDDGLA